MRKIIYRITAIVLTMTLSFGLVTYAKESDTIATDNSTQGIAAFADDYDEYIASSKFAVAKEKDEFSVSAENFTETKGADIDIQSEYLGEQGVIVWSNGTGKVTYTIDVQKSALYCINLIYLPLKGNGLDITVGLEIDGEYPFSSAEEITLNRMWVNASDPYLDSIGNQYSAEQTEYNKFVERSLIDTTGVHITPYEFVLSEGTHTITIETLSQSFALSEIRFTAPERPVGYKEYIKAYSDNENYHGDVINIEGEDAFLKNSRSLVAKSDNSSANVFPSSASITKLNYIGGSNWSSPNDELIWKFTTDKDGWYKIGFSFKQDTLVNGTSYRTLKIDGNIPFEEASKLQFNYDTKWQFESARDKDNNDYLFYIEKGEHTISMSATLGDIAPIYTQLNDLIFDMGQLYLDVIMITGETPDSNRDYDLFKQIPHFNTTLEDLVKRLNGMTEQMKDITGEESNEYIAAFNNTVRVLNQMIENPYSAHIYISDYYSQYSTLGSWLSSMKKMPLSLDRIQLASPEEGFEINNVGFFGSVWFSIKRFFLSFTEDYNRLAVDQDSDKQIKIWINWGRDQAMVLNSLIQQSFTPKTGISVNLELTNASLIKGMLSNTQPDLQLHMNRVEPINLAMRGALYDLTQFEDYGEVIERFGESAIIPYTYKDGVYALPDTQNFYIMFYRTDIFEELGLQVPKTWNEFLDVTANIERNNMTVSLPYTQITSTTTVNTGVGGLNLFASILQQYGGNVYNDKLNASLLREPLTLEAFTFWTDMYSKYKIPTVQNFYNRFKVGTCPLGIDVYTQYTQILEAAPEIAGCWDIALVPGFENEDGSINRCVSGSGTGCAILEKSKNKDAAWEFLKWWTSAETQLTYNNNVESILGAISRTTTATTEAFEQMSWDKDDLKILMEQRNNIIEVPEVPGGYYLTRAVDQAFWQVVGGQINAKDALVYWGEVADNEITRKIKQYS